MEKCSRILSAIDPFAPRLQLTVFQQQKHSTGVSVFLSLLLGLISLLLLENEIEGMLHQSHPSVVTAQTKQISPPVYPLNSNNFTLMVYIMNKDKQIIQGWDIYFNYDLRMCEKRVDPITKISSVNCTIIPLEECSIQKHFQSAEQQIYFQNFNFTGTKCIQYDWWIQNQLLIGGTLVSNRYIFLDFHIYLCENRTSQVNSQVCASDQESSKVLLGSFFFTHLSSNLIDFSKRGNPYSYCVKVVYTPISTNIQKSITVLYSQTTTISDIGYIVQKQEIEDTIILKEYQDVAQLDTSYGVFVRLVLTMDDFPQNNIRTYPKLQNIVGQVGGLVSLLFQICSLIFYPIINSMMRYNLALWMKQKQKNALNNQDDQSIDIKQRFQKLCNILKLTIGLNIPFQEQIEYINKYLDITNIIENLIEINRLKQIFNESEYLSPITMKASVVDDMERGNRYNRLQTLNFSKVQNIQRSQQVENFTLRFEEEGKIQSVLVMEPHIQSNLNTSPLQSQKNSNQKLKQESIFKQIPQFNE